MINREQIIPELEEFLDFLLKEGYCDTDVYAEPPSALDRYVAKHLPLNTDRLEQQPEVSEHGCKNYEADDTTAMNCKWCGNPKWVHDCSGISQLPQPISEERITELAQQIADNVGGGLWGDYYRGAQAGIKAALKELKR